MLVLAPESVEFEGESWPAVELISIDRTPKREVVEVGDLGPQVVFVDVPERRVNVRVVRRIERSELDSVKPGDSGELSFRAGFGRTDAGWSVVTVGAVVTRVTHEFEQSGVKRVVVMVAVSADGVTDPVSVEEV
ncbi:MAG: hypothetical protein KDA31_14065 [Phycisphaerales bacterium]|nr:hypothetical protein [Phycisphaerales bacterium]MCB9836069.1 hypothetical protein [Phycisphaera sp.]